MSITVTRGTNRPGATFKLLDPATGKTIASGTADANGNVTLTNVPVGRWLEQTSFTLPESGGAARSVVEQTPQPTEFMYSGAQYGPLVSDPNGSVWQITVTTGGVLGATKIAP